tara:strand:- start:6432 stop:6662 length:231 start_codon:yes stop_codon:yes gene_type:complete
MDEIVKQCKNIEYSWLSLSEISGNLSKDIRNKDNVSIEKNIIILITILLKISIDYKLDMQNAWERWHSKAISKHYD